MKGENHQSEREEGVSALKGSKNLTAMLYVTNPLIKGSISKDFPPLERKRNDNLSLGVKTLFEGTYNGDPIFDYA